MKIVAKTLYGLENLLAEELKNLGVKKLEILNRAIQFEGDLALLYRLNLSSRLALRFLVPLTDFTAHNDRHLYSLAQKVEWDQYLSLKQTFAIDATTNSERFRHSHYASLKVKDAIVDWFRTKYGRRPNIETRDPDIRINLHISDTNVSISLDASGESLEKRGYRQEANDAPISEVLAAGMLTFMKYDGSKPIVDAMTGSGTIAIEAGLIATNTAPGLHRTFAFQNWANYDSTLFEKIQQELAQQASRKAPLIKAWDIDRRTISIAKRNARRANMDQLIEIERQDFLKAEPFSEKAIIIMNPPYGERLEDSEEMEEFYHEVGSRLKHHFPGHKVGIISSNFKALKRIGLKPDEKHKLYNGALECSFNQYTLFEGKLKK